MIEDYGKGDANPAAGYELPKKSDGAPSETPECRPETRRDKVNQEAPTPDAARRNVKKRRPQVAREL